MTKLTSQKVAELGYLARIGLNEADHKRLSTELEPVLDHVETLRQIDTTNVDTTSQVTGLRDVWREDVVREECSRDDLLRNAPATEDGYIKVRRVL